MSAVTCKNRKNHPANVGEVLKQFSMFGAQFPTFNIKGQTKVYTMTGAILTFLLILVFSGYAALKLTHLFDKYNPNIAELKESNFYDFNERVNLQDIGFQMAFTVEGYLDKKRKDDPRYVKLLARIYYITDDKEHEKILSLHKCTDKDWSEFPEPARGMGDQVVAIKNDPDRGMYCLDKDELEGIEIYGDEKNQNYARLEVFLLPCNYNHTEVGFTGDVIHPECIRNLTQ